MAFSKIPTSSRAWTIFIMSFIWLLETFSVTVPESLVLFWIPTYTCDAATVIPNGAKIFFLPMQLHYQQLSGISLLE